MSLKDHVARIHYTTDDDGIHIDCDCGWTVCLGFRPTLDDLDDAFSEHIKQDAEKVLSNIFSFFKFSPADCPHAPHRGPEGPNEDLAQCFACGMPSYSMRPWGETIGHHLPDCALPVWHPSFCEPGGDGHPPAPKIRG